MNKLLQVAFVLIAGVLAAGGSQGVPDDSGAGAATTVRMIPGEKWWGLSAAQGTSMPWDECTQTSVDLRKSGGYNVFSSLLVSNRGRYVWCANTALFDFSNGVITVTSDAGAPVEVAAPGTNLREAFRAVAAKHFPASGRAPDPLFFSAPQYCTWIELTYHQNERDILAYAKSMVDNGLPPGVFMIDDTWQAGYGDWRFEPTRFPDPKGMVRKLHDMGFKVILWMCPWVSMDTPAFRRVAYGVNPDDVKGYPAKGGFLMDGDRPAADRWWNGFSALLDFTHPNARAWFDEQLDRLVRGYGVDGFKFDGGELESYVRGYRAHDGKARPAEVAAAYAEYATKFPVCEFRNGWKLHGRPVVERLLDKDHSWKALGLLIPDLIAGGLLGNSFMCPDMIGGGQWETFLPGSPFDPELFIRSVQVHLLCGMMQFSASPWRVLDAEGQRIVRDLVRMRQERFAGFFVKLAEECGRTGEPMIRNLEYVFPRRGYADVRDEFLMGDSLLVAPQLAKGAAERTVVLPPGQWRSDEGVDYDGPGTITVRTPLARLPYFLLQEGFIKTNGKDKSK